MTRKCGETRTCIDSDNNVLNVSRVGLILAEILVCVCDFDRGNYAMMENFIISD